MHVTRDQVIDLVIGQIAFFLACFNQVLDIVFVLVFHGQASHLSRVYFG